MNNAITVNPGELDHAANGHPRVPLAILADTSYSMNGAPLSALQEGLKLLFDDIGSDRLAQLRCDPTIFTFGGHVTQAMPWESKMVGLTPVPTFQASGDTPLGEAVYTAISAIQMRRGLYREKTIQSFAPWVVILTDGNPTDDWQPAADQLAQLVIDKKWNVICVATGPGANTGCLARFSPHHPPLEFKDENSTVCFKEFFQWLSSSIKVSSRKATTCAPQMAPLPANISFTD